MNAFYNNDKKVVNYIKYNYQVNCDRTIPTELIDIIAILHYIGKAKPWVYRNIVESSILYWNVICQMRYIHQYLIARGIALLKCIVTH